MSARRRLAVAALAAGLLASSAQADDAPVRIGRTTWRWVDATGTVHYGDQPPQGGRANTVKLQPSVVETSAGDFATSEAARRFPVVLYTAPECGENCDRVRKWLGERRIPLREVSVATAESIQTLRTASGGNVVPVVTVGRQALSGFEPEQIASILRSAGYPIAGLAPIADSPPANPDYPTRP
jgi:arsenate reductase-like glutaredoxin family protein